MISPQGITLRSSRGASSHYFFVSIDQRRYQRAHHKPSNAGAVHPSRTQAARPGPEREDHDAGGAGPRAHRGVVRGHAAGWRGHLLD